MLRVFAFGLCLDQSISRHASQNTIARGLFFEERTLYLNSNQLNSRSAHCSEDCQVPLVDSLGALSSNFANLLAQWRRSLGSWSSDHRSSGYRSSAFELLYVNRLLNPEFPTLTETPVRPVRLQFRQAVPVFIHELWISWRKNLISMINSLHASLCDNAFQRFPAISQGSREVQWCFQLKFLLHTGEVSIRSFQAKFSCEVSMWSPPIGIPKRAKIQSGHASVYNPLLSFSLSL